MALENHWDCSSLLSLTLSSKSSESSDKRVRPCFEWEATIIAAEWKPGDVIGSQAHRLPKVHQTSFSSHMFLRPPDE